MKDFVFGRVLGKGAYAVVKECQRRGGKEKFAMKIYDKKKLMSSGKLKRVEKEIQLLKEIGHENIVKIIDSFESKTSINLLMECVEAKSLAHLISDVP